jgi:hypothetical protein
MHHAAAIAAAFTRAKSRTVARANPTTPARADPAIGPGPIGERSAHHGGRVPQVRHITVGQLDVLRHHNRGVYGQLGVVVADDFLWRHILCFGDLGQMPHLRLYEFAVTAATATTHHFHLGINRYEWGNISVLGQDNLGHQYLFRAP